MIQGAEGTASRGENERKEATIDDRVEVGITPLRHGEGRLVPQCWRPADHISLAVCWEQRASEVHDQGFMKVKLSASHVISVCNGEGSTGKDRTNIPEGSRGTFSWQGGMVAESGF